MSFRAFQFFCVGAALGVCTANAEIVTGENYTLRFVDFDGRTISTADDVISLVVLTSRADTAKAQLVAARVPDFCLGNPDYRMVTVVNVVRARIASGLVRLFIRRRLNAEAAQLQRRYDAARIRKDARRDIFIVPDFDGKATASLGVESAAPAFRVFVFGRDGKLLREWRDVPDATELAAALRSAS